MRETHPSRRTIIAGAAATAASLAAPALAQAAPQVVVIGGGYAGATCARFLQREGVAVTLVEPAATYISCPFSNAVIAGLRDIAQQTFTYDAIAAQGVRIARQAATKIDRDARRVTLADGATLSYDRLVLAPGVDMNFAALPGYDEAASRNHAARVEGWAADASAPPATRSDGGRRHGRDLARPPIRFAVRPAPTSARASSPGISRPGSRSRNSSSSTPRMRFRSRACSSPRGRKSTAT